MLRAVLIALLIGFLPTHVQAEARIALLIGNKDYKPGVGTLTNPLNDTRIVSEALKAIGFEVLKPVQNARRADMLIAIHAFAKKLRNAGSDAVGFLYYSGHGIASAGENYLIPVDVDEPSTVQLSVQRVKQSEVLAILRSEAPNAAHYLILDACRNTLQGARGGKGFVPVGQQSGVLVGFATEPGKTASDTGQSSGPYAAALAAELVKPDQSDLIMFHHVRVAVMERTGGDQVPWTEDGIQRRERVQFGGVSKLTHQPQSGEAEREWQQYAKDTKDTRLLEAFKAKHKADPFYVRLAEARIAELKRERVATAAPPAVPLAEIPSDLLGQWSDSETSCTDDPSKGVTVFTILPRAIGWYEIDCDAAFVRWKDGASLKVNCEKGGGAKGTGDIEIRRVNPNALEVSVSRMSFMGEQRSRVRKCVGATHAKQVCAHDGQIEVAIEQNERRCFKPGAGKTEQFKDRPTCPVMVVVPAGSFTMGSPASESERANGESRVPVAIAAPFAVGRFAVTFDEWDACVSDGGCKGYKPADQGWGRGKHPVINVNWEDAKAYGSWLTHKTGNPYRLLSEAEREYVTRASTTTPFWWGASITPKQANYDGNHTYAGGGSKGEYRLRTVPVDSFDPNPWGLYQVHGNVWEWTEDCWNDSNAGNPGDGRARTTVTCTQRVVRGGSWIFDPQYLRSASRYWWNDAHRNYDQGFRLARTLAP